MKYKSSFSPFTSRSKPDFISETALTFPAHFILYRKVHSKEGKWVPEERRRHSGLLSRNHGGEHGDVLSPPTLLKSTYSPLAGNHSWMLHLWLSPTPFQCGRTLKCTLQSSQEKNCLPGPATAFRFENWLQNQKKLLWANFLFWKESMRCQKNDFKKCFWKFLDPRMFSRCQFGLIPNNSNP